MLEHLTLVTHAPVLVDDPLQVITDPAGWVASWLWPAIFGKDQVAQPTWAGDLFANAFFFTGLDPSRCTGGGGGGNCTSFSIWSALQTTGYLVLAMALMFRMLRIMADGRPAAAKVLLFDIIVRAALGVAAINLSFIVLSMLMASSIRVGGALFDTVMSVTTNSAGGEAGLRQALAGIISPVNLPPIPLILETLVLLYLAGLILASRVAIIFAIAVAPLVLPLYAFNSQNSMLVWWLRLVAQGLLVPIVMGPLFAIALVLIQGVNGVGGGAMAPLIGTVTAVVSMWMVGHTIMNLLKHVFPEHKSFLAGASNLQGRVGFVRGRVAAAVSPVTSVIRRR